MNCLKCVELGRLEGKSSQVGSRGKANKLKQKVKIEYRGVVPLRHLRHVPPRGCGDSG